MGGGLARGRMFYTDLQKYTRVSFQPGYLPQETDLTGQGGKIGFCEKTEQNKALERQFGHPALSFLCVPVVFQTGTLQASSVLPSHAHTCCTRRAGKQG